jgi:Lon-like protease
MTRPTLDRPHSEGDPIVVLDSGVVRVPPQRRRLRAIGTFLLVLITVASVLSSVIRLDRVAYTPGSATGLTDRISLSGAPQYRPGGSFLLATVGLTDRLTVAQWVRARFNPDVSIRTYEEVFPSGRTEELERGRVMMDDSKTLATLAALRYLGQDGKGQGVKVIAVEPNTPADGTLRPGDEILRIDNRSICVAGDLRAGIMAAAASTPVTLEVRRAGTRPNLQVQVSPTTIKGFRLIGVAVETIKCDLPIDVKIETANIGGPSAGLSMTLAIIDLLTPGELTGGNVVAATGTIDGSGQVGDVGGVRQKTAGVRSVGAKLFLVPPGEEQEAKARAGKLTVVAVSNLDDALAALRQFGGQPLPSPRATP